MTITGVAAGVPYVALPPAHDGPAPLVAVWHLLDTPRSREEMAKAVPMTGVPAWRVYFGLPFVNDREAPGTRPPEERLANEDYTTQIALPIVDQAAAEFPAALAELRTQLSIADGPVALAGGSMGGQVVYQVIARGEVPVATAALVNPLTRVAPIAQLVHQQYGSGDYIFTDEKMAAQEHLDFVRRANEITVPLLVVQGENDLPPFVEAVTRLKEILGEQVELVTVPGMGHPIADEPSNGQNEHGRRVDAEFTRWFNNRWLSSTA